MCNHDSGLLRLHIHYTTDLLKLPWSELHFVMHFVMRKCNFDYANLTLYTHLQGLVLQANEINY